MAFYDGNLTSATYFQRKQVSEVPSHFSFIRTIYNSKCRSFYFSQLESRKFSSSMKVTVPNVIGFILSNLNQPNRLRAMSTILSIKHQERQSFQSAVIALQRDTDVSISDNLKLWRRHPLKRPYILRRIQALRQLYLELFRQIDKRDLVKLNELIQNVLNVWVFNS